MGTKILRYQVRPGDTLRISRDVTLADRIGGSDWLTESGEDIDLDIHDIELVNRPEPPKPAAKVGDKLTLDVAEPPVGARVAAAYEGSLVVRHHVPTEENGAYPWYALINGSGYNLSWCEIATGNYGAYYLTHLPGE